MTDIEQRKRDHIDIVLSGAARHSANAGFDAIAFDHNALPELSLDAVDLKTIDDRWAAGCGSRQSRAGRSG